MIFAMPDGGAVCFPLTVSIIGIIVCLLSSFIATHIIVLFLSVFSGLTKAPCVNDILELINLQLTSTLSRLRILLSFACAYN
jgi:hypothetical protein